MKFGSDCSSRASVVDNWCEQPVQMRSQSCRWLNGLIKRLIYLRVRCNVGLCEIYTPPPPLAPSFPSCAWKLRPQRRSTAIDHGVMSSFYVFYVLSNNATYSTIYLLIYLIVLPMQFVSFHKRIWVLSIIEKKKKYMIYADINCKYLFRKKIYWSLEIFEYNYLRKRGFNFVKFTL